MTAHNHNKIIPVLSLAAMIAFSALISGCRGHTTGRIQLGPQRDAPTEKGLDTLRNAIIDESAKIRNIKADVEIAIVSPLLQQPPQLDLSGRIAIKKWQHDGLPLAAVGMDAKYGRTLATRSRDTGIQLVGDGRDYEVDMSIFDISYSGHYNDFLAEKDDRIHFTPVEIANVFNMEGLMSNRPQLLRAYPAHWDHSAIAENQPVEFPPRWSIDSIEIRDEQRPFPWVHNSIVLDRNQQRPLKIDTFRPDGSLMSRTWIMEERQVRLNDDTRVSVPSEIMIWYPPPLEGTVIRMRLSRARINEELSDSALGFLGLQND